MKNLLKTLMISGLLSSSFNMVAQDNNKPESSLSNKVKPTNSNTLKQDKPIDALSSKTATINELKKDSSSQELPKPQPKAVLSEKKELK